MLLCLDRKDGKILWEREVASSPLEPLHKLNSYAEFDAGDRWQTRLRDVSASAAKDQ